MTTLIRAASLSGFEDCARDCGIDVTKTVQRAGLTLKALRDPEALIPYIALMQLLERAARDSGRADFGQRMSLRQSVSILGPIAVLMEHVDTVGEAFRIAARYVFVHSPAIRFSVDPVVGNAARADLRFSIDMPRLPPHGQTIELSLGVIVRVLDLLGQGELKPLCVLVPHARLAAAETYRRTYGCVCLFDQAHAAVRLDAGALTRPLARRDRVLRELAQNYLDTRFTRADQTFIEKVRWLVRDYLSAGMASHAPIASMLAVHVRTMQRRLDSEGTTFEAIKDEVRRDRFEQLLASNSSLQLSQIAAMLDYANQSALTRSCRRWFGISPSQYLSTRVARSAVPS
jgi:AraC-like DNA-binding protein